MKKSELRAQVERWRAEALRLGSELQQVRETIDGIVNQQTAPYVAFPQSPWELYRTAMWRRA